MVFVARIAQNHLPFSLKSVRLALRKHCFAKQSFCLIPARRSGIAPSAGSHSNEVNVTRATDRDAMHAIGELSLCATEADANNLTLDIVESLGAQLFVYTTLLPPDSEALDGTFRFFIGCGADLCQMYSERMWIMNDPFLDYARTNSSPILGSQINLRTPGQIEMRRVSAEHGFRSGMAVPTHTSMNANKRMGLLYVGLDLPEQIGEPILWAQRVKFGALGMELLLWWSNRLKQQAMRKYSLMEDEVDLLQMSRKGMVATEISALLDIKITAVYRKLNTIKEKLNVDKIDQAVLEAESVGLLG